MITICNYDGTKTVITDEEEPAYWEKIRQERNAKEPNKTVHRINVKGYCNQIFLDSQTERKFVDTIYGNGVIIFNGNWDEYDEYLKWLSDNEGKLGIKII